MTSIRVPPGLLAQLHEAAPAGTSLPALLRGLIEESGGPAAIRARWERKQRRETAKTQVRRLRLRRHRSVLIAPDEQLALAEACASWVQLQEESGQRIHDPVARRLVLRPRRRTRSPPGRIRMERREGIAP